MKAYTEHAVVNKGSQCFFSSSVLVLVLCYSYKNVCILIYCFYSFFFFFLLKITAIGSLGSDTHLCSCLNCSLISTSEVEYDSQQLLLSYKV